MTVLPTASEADHVAQDIFADDDDLALLAY